MKVTFVNINQEEFLKEKQFLYRFVSIDRLHEMLSKGAYSFAKPSVWSDPFEKFYLEREYSIDNNIYNLPIKNFVYCSCFSGTASSEAFWKVYTPDGHGVRLRINTQKLLNSLMTIPDCRFVFGKVEYTSTKSFISTSIGAKVAKEILSGKSGINQMELLLKKRISFQYEDEYRLFMFPPIMRKNNPPKVIFKEMDVRGFTDKFLLSPIMGKETVKIMKSYFHEKFGIDMVQSALYKDGNRDPIVVKFDKNNN